MSTGLYYSEFRGDTFVIQAEDEAVENSETTLSVLRGIDDLLRHRIRVVLVFGKGEAFEQELMTCFGARQHQETSRLVIPQNALPRILAQRTRIADAITAHCQALRIPCRLLPESAVRAERRIAHGSTGVATGIDVPAVRSVLDEGKLAILGFGGEDDHGRFLQVLFVSLAADLAVQLGAQKLFFLTRAGGICLPHRRADLQQLSFADLEQLLCLLQRKDNAGRFLLDDAVLPKVHASIRAVAGHVNQVHIVSYACLLDEILTRTGVGTMIELRQSHHVDDARPEDLSEIERLHTEAQRYTTQGGTPIVKPLGLAQLERLLPHTLLLTHRGIMVGKLHATEVPDAPRTLMIGGLVVGENHQDSQHGQLLLSEALSRFRERGYTTAVAITAAERAKRLFTLGSATPPDSGAWQTKLLAAARDRYHPEERDEVELLEFTL